MSSRRPFVSRSSSEESTLTFLLLNRTADVYNPVMLRLLTFPLITIATINGHCFAGGFLLALACDFRLMREEQEGRRAWCCMNEVRSCSPFLSILRVERC